MSRKENYFIRVTLTPEQVRVLNDALDIYSRIHIGQFHRIREEFWSKLPDRAAVDRMEAFLYSARQEAFPELTGGPNHSHSMSGHRVKEAGKIAYDIKQVVRVANAYARHPEGGHTVDFNSPLWTSVSTPRPVAKAVSILDRLADA